MKRIFALKKIVFMALVLAALSGVFLSGKEANAASTTGKVPITSYVTGYNSVRTYSGINGAGTGWIYSGDKCTILNVYSSGWCRVRYPVGKGTRTAYTYSKYFFSDINFSTATTTPGKNMTVYTKPNLKTKLGTTYSGDNILVIGSLNGNQQILYPISGGYKMGFVSGLISSSGYAAVVYNGKAENIEAMLFDATFYANEYSDLKAAFGYDKAQLYNHWKRHGIREGRGASPILNLKYYIDNNDDLRRAFGATGYEEAYRHFISHGYAEYRNSSKYYNGDYYRRNYTDLKQYDSLFLVNHYLEYGIREGRNANTVKYVPGVSNDESTNTYSVSGNLLTVKGVAMSDYKIGGKYTNSNYATVNGKRVYMAGSHCCGYARYIAYKLFGCHDKSAPSKFKDVSGYVAAGKLTTAKIKEAVTEAGVGAHIRTNGSQHSLAIIGVTDSGFAVTDANSDGKLTIRVVTYTWSSYVDSKYGKRGLQYIKKYVG